MQVTREWGCYCCCWCCCCQTCHLYSAGRPSFWPSDGV